MANSTPGSISWLSSASRSNNTPGSVIPGAGSQQGFAAVLHGFNEASNWGDFNTGGKIQRGYVINPFTDQFANTIIRSGQMCFIARNLDASNEAGASSADNQSWSVVNLFMMNRMLRDGYHKGLQKFSTLGENHPLMKRLLDVELRSNELYSDGYGRDIMENREAHMLPFFSKEGICTRWNPLGYSLLPSAPDTQTRNEFAYLPLNIGFRGTFKIENHWGPNAAHSSHLFYIHKRVKEPDTGKWGPMAFVPHATIEDFPSHSERRYIGFGGQVEWGDVYYRGTVCDSLGQSMTGNELLTLQGLNPAGDSIEEFAVGKAAPKIDVIFQDKYRGKYFTPV